MANREALPFTVCGQHRRELGEVLAPGRSVVATLTLRPRAQLTPEEKTTLGSGGVVHQWGLGIGPDPCNKLYVMHRAIDGDFANAELFVQMKSNPSMSTSAECGNSGYLPGAVKYSGPDLGILVVARTPDGATLTVRAYDLYGATQLGTDFSIAVPAHWTGNCAISMRSDNCFADGVVTV